MNRLQEAGVVVREGFEKRVRWLEVRVFTMTVLGSIGLVILGAVLAVLGAILARKL